MLTCRIHFFWYSFLQIFVSFVCCLCVVDLAATPMSSYYPIVYKQQVVTYYTQHLPHTSFRAVARLFNIKGWSYDSRRVGMTDVTHCCTKQKSGRPTISFYHHSKSIHILQKKSSNIIVLPHQSTTQNYYHM